MKKKINSLERFGATSSRLTRRGYPLRMILSVEFATCHLLRTLSFLTRLPVPSRFFFSLFLFVLITRLTWLPSLSLLLPAQLTTLVSGWCDNLHAFAQFASNGTENNDLFYFSPLRRRRRKKRKTPRARTSCNSKMASAIYRKLSFPARG